MRNWKKGYNEVFTIDQIMAARAKIRSSDDFPLFLEEMLTLGVTGYETFPADGHSAYFGDDGFGETVLVQAIP